MNKLTLLVAAVGLLSLTSCGDSEASESVIRLSAIPDSKINELKEQGDALAAYLSEKIGRPVRYAKASDYAATVNGIAANKLDLVWYGGVTAVDADDRTGGKTKILACRQEDLQFKTYFIANKDSLDSGKVKRVDSLEELKPMLEDLRFRFGSRLSTSGHIMPRYFMTQAGIDPEKDFRGGPSYSLVSSHSETLEAVASGAVDVGALNYTNYDRAPQETKDKAPIIYVTPTYVDYCLVAHTRLGEDVMQKIQQAMVELDPNNPEHEPLLDAFSASKFVKADPTAWNQIRDVRKTLDAEGNVK